MKAKHRENENKLSERKTAPAGKGSEAEEVAEGSESLDVDELDPKELAEQLEEAKKRLRSGSISSCGAGRSSTTPSSEPPGRRRPSQIAPRKG